MRPVRAKALIINAFALTGRFAIFNPYTQGVALGYGRLWAFSPHCMSFDALSSYICKDNFELLLIVFTSSPQDTICVCGILL